MGEHYQSPMRVARLPLDDSAAAGSAAALSPLHSEDTGEEW